MKVFLVKPNKKFHLHRGEVFPIVMKRTIQMTEILTQAVCKHILKSCPSLNNVKSAHFSSKPVISKQVKETSMLNCFCSINVLTLNVSEMTISQKFGDH